MISLEQRLSISTYSENAVLSISVHEQRLFNSTLKDINGQCSLLAILTVSFVQDIYRNAYHTDPRNAVRHSLPPDPYPYALQPHFFAGGFDGGFAGPFAGGVAGAFVGAFAGAFWPALFCCEGFAGAFGGEEFFD